MRPPTMLQPHSFLRFASDDLLRCGGDSGRPLSDYGLLAPSRNRVGALTRYRPDMKAPASLGVQAIALRPVLPVGALTHPPYRHTTQWF